MAFCTLALPLAILFHVSAILASDRIVEGTVAFATVGRAHYAFDIFLLNLPQLARGGEDSASFELRLTDGSSVNYNGFLVDVSDRHALLKALNNKADQLSNLSSTSHGMLAYVSERDGTARVHFNLYMQREPGREFINEISEKSMIRREASELELGVFNLGTLSMLESTGNGVKTEPTALHDRPGIANGKLIFTSTRERRDQSRQGWNAVYSTDIRTKQTVRLTPEDVTDYSPAVSPSGELVMVASFQGRGWSGEIEDLATDLYVFKAEDGSDRRLITKHGGWPSWADDSTVYFHRRAADGWWSVFRVRFSGAHVSEPERITPPGVHAFTPAASRTGKWIAVTTRRPESGFRHVELFDLASGTFHKVTEKVSPEAHHYNPFVSPDSEHLGYHRCRGRSSITPRLEQIKSPIEGLALVRVDGDFPVFSADGEYIAFIPDLDIGGIYITSLDGSGMVQIFNETAFGLSWDKQRNGVLYTSYGLGFKSVDTTVHIVSILNADKLISGEAQGVVNWKRLTKTGTSNNAFPSASPDGKKVVFRSGRSGQKNLYIMDAVRGEEGGLSRLTEGAWTDTMPNWSPDGEWIAFSSDRHNPGGGSFALYFVHPNGTGLHRVLNSSTGGRVNHPFFSPDSKSMVFTTDYAGVSAEPVSVPAQFQPYGEIFLAKIDGSELRRLTHNSYEDGTPSWGPKTILSPTNHGLRGDCKFVDSRWLKPPEVAQTGRC